MKHRKIIMLNSRSFDHKEIAFFEFEDTTYRKFWPQESVVNKRNKPEL
jgi:hypothetical protein